MRGVVYEEEEEEQGGSMWRMEVNQVEQLPASQQPSVMDTGVCVYVCVCVHTCVAW